MILFTPMIHTKTHKIKHLNLTVVQYLERYRSRVQQLHTRAGIERQRGDGRWIPVHRSQQETRKRHMKCRMEPRMGGLY